MAPIPSKPTLVFDVYGTLLDISSVSPALAKALSLSEDKTKDLEGVWRQLTREYTFRLNSMGLYEPYDVVIRKSFVHAASASGYDVSDEIIDQAYSAYRKLGAYSDTPDAMKELQKRGRVDMFAFSNGTPEMIETALDAGGISSLIPRRFFVESAQAYKPSKALYESLLKHIGREKSPDSVYLVSGTPYDIVGARQAGMSAVWVNRADAKWTDSLTDHKPNKMVNGLGELADLFA